MRTNQQRSPLAQTDAVELHALLDAVRDFSHGQVRPLVERPESPLPVGTVDTLLDQMGELGLLTGDGDPGLGLWDDPHDPASCRLSMDQLAVVAEDSPGLALAAHVRAVAGGLDRQVGVIGQQSVITLEGGPGVAARPMGAVLAGRNLGADDVSLLKDVWGAPAKSPRLLIAPGRWGAVWWLQWSSQGFQLVRTARAELLVQPAPDSHGFDELETSLCTAKGDSSQTAVPLVDTLTVHALGLLTIAAATARRSIARARTFAQTRRQGGELIGRHDAVAQLLSRAENAVVTTQALLDHAAGMDSGLPRLLAVWRARAQCHPLLTAAGNDALQVFGGLGYMRDVGVERDQRDLNSLRRLAGSPPELTLRCAELDDPTGGETASAKNGALPVGHPLSIRSVDAGLPKTLHAIFAESSATLWEAQTLRLPRGLQALRRRARTFARTQLTPLALEMDRLPHWPVGQTPPPLQRLLGTAGRGGWLSDILPKPIGSGSPMVARHPLPFAASLKVEEFARVDGGLMLLLSANMLGQAPLILSADPRIISRRLLPGIRRSMSGDPYLFAFAITEPGAGSDVEEGHGASLAKPGVIARRAPGGWVLNGRKVYISGGDIAQGYTVFAALEGEGFESWTCFFVERDAAGFGPVRTELKMGMRASGAAELEFVDVFVPDADVVGRVRGGWALNRQTLNLSRLPVAAMAVGFAQAACDIAMDYALRTTTGGRAIIGQQSVQLALADAIAATSSIRAQVWQSAGTWKVSQGVSAMNKFHATDTAMQVIDQCLDLLGPNGLLHGNSLEKVWRDARLTQIFEGTNQINRLALMEDIQDRFDRSAEPGRPR